MNSFVILKSRIKELVVKSVKIYIRSIEIYNNENNIPR